VLLALIFGMLSGGISYNRKLALTVRLRPDVGTGISLTVAGTALIR